MKIIKKSALVLALLSCLFSYAQSITVSGEVSDTSGALPGVSVMLKGTNKGTTTDIDGKYLIKTTKGAVLVFSYLGYKNKEVVVNSSKINITLEEDSDLLDEVVVTAFGIKKKEKSLGYSVQKVDASELNTSGSTNALESLQGRVAGLQINRTSGSAGGGVDILIRGVTSVNPDRNNQPLIIIDGLALDNDTFSGKGIGPSQGSNSLSPAEQFSFTNRAADINPEDIESFNVLKGAAASALYGVRASNGAIIITTKKGKLGKPRINISASTTVRQIVTTPELQKTYREGWNGRVEMLYTPETATGFTSVYSSTPFQTWGPKYSDNSVINPDGSVIDLTKDRFYDPYELFRTGINTQLNFNISGASEKIDYFFSVGKSNDEGVMPNTGYSKTNFRFKSGYKATPKFNINSSISYSKSGGSRANGGDKSVMSSLSYFSPTFPINDYLNKDGSQRNFTPWIDNPRYFLEKSNLKDNVNRWVGNIKLNWTPKEWLNIVYSAQVDNYSDERNRFVPQDLDVGTQVKGFLVEQKINFLGLESNFLATLTKDWSSDFRTTLTLGNQISDSKRNFTSVRGENLNVPGINDLTNTIEKFVDNDIRQLRNVGVFGELKLDYQDKLFLTLTGRNDWLSTLPQKNRSFFYPSVSLAYNVASLVENKDILTYGKIRASWAEVGKGPGFGKVGHYFIADENFPFGGVGGYRSSTALGDINIVPERNQSLEIGFDLRFLNNRIRLDYSYYKTKVKDQIFSVRVPYSSGLSLITRNAGDFETFGHEFLLSAYIFKNETFKWETTLNWSTNQGQVLDIPDNLESIVFVSSGFAGVTSEVREGDKIGTLYGYKWRYENGERYIGSDGKPRVKLDERVIVGNAFPDFITSVRNDLSYKNFSFNFLLEWKKGGDLYDSGRRNSIRNGILGLTEFRNEKTILEGVMDDGNGGFTKNTQEVLIDQNYYRSSTRYNRASEILIQDASWVKLRNIGFTYNLKGNVLESLKMNSLSISASAQNLLLWTPFEGFDPEGNQYSSGSNVYGFTGLNTPISESYSLGVKLGF